MLGGLSKLLTWGRSPADAGGDKITLAQVLAHDWCELWYQPKIELKTMRLVGAEALVRARHPQRGVLGPGAFLPGASDADMLALTERVIISALRDWEDCAARGVSIKFSVNVPVSALVKLPIPAILRKERPKAANWPGLIMEVTEDEIIHDLQIANDVADSLRAFNCTLALDDFGAGYSSLARLRQLPFSELKIDRSYVSNCHRDRAVRGDRPARPAVRAQDGRRGHRDHPRVPQIAGGRLRYRAGLPVRQADAQGPAHRDDAQAPGGPAGRRPAARDTGGRSGPGSGRQRLNQHRLPCRRLIRYSQPSAVAPMVAAADRIRLAFKFCRVRLAVAASVTCG
jgi:EAL domain-containing protein (putative c-di-GMP-specific phosphodiesterase class I)